MTATSPNRALLVKMFGHRNKNACAAFLFAFAQVKGLRREPLTITNHQQLILRWRLESFSIKTWTDADREKSDWHWNCSNGNTNAHYAVVHVQYNAHGRNSALLAFFFQCQKSPCVMFGNVSYIRLSISTNLHSGDKEARKFCFNALCTDDGR